jgi:hypothetical protein
VGRGRAQASRDLIAAAEMSVAIRACLEVGRGHIEVRRINGAPRRYLDVVPHDAEAAVATYTVINGVPPARVIG